MRKIRNGLERALNWVKVGAVSLPLIVGPYGCEKPDDPEPIKDTTPPKINILSPTNGEIFYDKIIPISWKIDDENDFKEAMLYVINEENVVNKDDGFSIPQSGSLNWEVKSGYNTIVIEAFDLALNPSKDSVKVFYWNDLVRNNTNSQ